jgi:hypothetical protein
VNPDVLSAGVHDLTASVAAESKKQSSGVFATLRRIFNGDALRGLSVALAAIESVGRTAQNHEKK